MPRLSWINSGNDHGLVLGRLGRTRFSPLLRLPTHVRNGHGYVVGLSGSGKSKFLEHCLFQDMAAGRGVGLIDPHSLLVDDLLKYALTAGVFLNLDIRQKLIYVDPSREDFVIPFNVLASTDTPYDTATSILEAFRRTWPDSLKEAPHFSNVVTAALIVLIENNLTLMDMPRLLTNQEFRDNCLQRVTEHSVIEFFHDRFDQWGREAPLMRESTLNKIGAFSLNPRLRLMLGQTANHLDFRAIMDEGKILLLDLGRADVETNRLIGSLVTTGLERAMRRRQNRKLWNLVIDEFAGYVANEGSIKSLAHVFSEGRKFFLGMTVAHQDLSQLTPRMMGALSNVQTKVIFRVGRLDAEYFAKLVGRVDTEAIKRIPKTNTQHELFESLPEQWEHWIDTIRFQQPRRATVAIGEGKVETIRTITIPPYTATDGEVDAIKRESLQRHGIANDVAIRNIEGRQRKQEVQSESIPIYGW